MDVECRTYQYLDGHDRLPQLGTVTARISECGSHGYQVAFRSDGGDAEAFVVPSLVAARAAVEQAVTAALDSITRADYEVRQQILAHRWWRTPVQAEDVDRILETASLHPDGAVLVDPRGGYAWIPNSSRHKGRHVCLEIPSGGHCLTGAAFALLKALDEAQRESGDPRRLDGTKLEMRVR